MADKDKKPPERKHAALSRHNPQCLNAKFERRLIVIAQGLQFQNKDHERKAQGLEKRDPKFAARIRADMVPHCLAKKKLVDRPPTDHGNGHFTAEYTNCNQHVKYRIEVVTKKDLFKKYLQDPKAHVVYEGHARWGRGPCFGDNTGPGEQWERGYRPTKDDGLFRMGFQFIGVPVLDIIHYKYLTSAAEATANVKGKRRLLLNPAGASRKSLKTYTLKELVEAQKRLQEWMEQGCQSASYKAWKAKHPTADWRFSFGGLSHVSDSKPDDLYKYIRNRQPSNPSAKFWGYEKRIQLNVKFKNQKTGKVRYYVHKTSQGKVATCPMPYILLYANWNGTDVTPMDIGATDLKCRVFCHFGCSTERRNWRILQFTPTIKKWKQEKGPQFAYFTTDTAYADKTRYWLINMLKYNKRSDGMYLKRCLKYTIVQTNRKLRNGPDKRKYQVCRRI